MSKFCIDLEGIMLPDAIAAVVEAWYDAQNENATALGDVVRPATDCSTMLYYKSINFDNYDYEESPWERLLRESIFWGCDEEWSLGARRGNDCLQTCLTHINKRGKTEWVLLPFEWSVVTANSIRDCARAIISWVEDEGKTLANAYVRVKYWYNDHSDDFV